MYYEILRGYLQTSPKNLLTIIYKDHKFRFFEMTIHQTYKLNKYQGFE